MHMKRIFCGCVLLLLTVPCYAQLPASLQTTLDSIERVLPETTGRTRYDLTFKAAYDLFDVDNDLAVRYAEDAFKQAGVLGDSAQIVRSGRIYGQLLRRVGKLKEAIGTMDGLLTLAEQKGYKKELRFLRHALALAYTYRGEYDKALEQNLKSLELRLEAGVRYEIFDAQVNTGNTFYHMGIYDRAAEFMRAALLTDSLIEEAASAKISLALCYTRLNYPNESKLLIEAVTRQYEGRLSAHEWTRIHICLGYLAILESNYVAAKKNFETGYQLGVTGSNKVYMSECLAFLGTAYLELKDFEKAEGALLESEHLAREIGYRNGVEIANLALAKLYAITFQHRKASATKSTIIAMRDSSINQRVIDNIYRYQFDFYEKQNKKTIADQEKLLAIQEEKIMYHLIANIASIVCGVLLIVLVTLLYRTSRMRKNQAKELEQKVHERTSELRASLERLQESQLQRNFLLDGISRKVYAQVATFKGLGVVARTFDNVPPEFAANVDKTADTLWTLLRWIWVSKK